MSDLETHDTQIKLILRLSKIGQRFIKLLDPDNSCLEDILQGASQKKFKKHPLKLSMPLLLVLEILHFIECLL